MLTRQLVIKDGADGHKWARNVTSNWRLKMSRDLYLYSKKEKATIKKILDSLQQADDMTMALDFIRSAILLVCTESATANDGHVVTDKEKKIVIGRMLMKALALFNDHEMPGLLQSFNADEEDFSHDTHGKLLLKIIDAELDQM